MDRKEGRFRPMFGTSMVEILSVNDMFFVIDTFSLLCPDEFRDQENDECILDSLD